LRAFPGDEGPVWVEPVPRKDMPARHSIVAVAIANHKQRATIRGIEKIIILRLEKHRPYGIGEILTYRHSRRKSLGMLHAQLIILPKPLLAIKGTAVRQTFDPRGTIAADRAAKPNPAAAPS
jgi:hypothetical protein